MFVYCSSVLCDEAMLAVGWITLWHCLIYRCFHSFFKMAWFVKGNMSSLFSLTSLIRTQMVSIEICHPT